MSDAPVKAESLEDRIKRLTIRTAKDGWKGPGSRAVHPETWIRAELIMREVLKRGGSKASFVSATDYGSLYVEWSAWPDSVWDASIEVLPSMKCDCEARRYSTYSWRDGVADNEAVTWVVERLREVS